MTLVKEHTCDIKTFYRTMSSIDTPFRKWKKCIICGKITYPPENINWSRELMRELPRYEAVEYRYKGDRLQCALCGVWNFNVIRIENLPLYYQHHTFCKNTYCVKIYGNYMNANIIHKSCMITPYAIKKFRQFI